MQSETLTYWQAKGFLPKVSLFNKEVTPTYSVAAAAAAAARHHAAASCMQLKLAARKNKEPHGSVCESARRDERCPCYIMDGVPRNRILMVRPHPAVELDTAYPPPQQPLPGTIPQRLAHSHRPLPE